MLQCAPLDVEPERVLRARVDLSVSAAMAFQTAPRQNLSASSRYFRSNS